MYMMIKFWVAVPAKIFFLMISHTNKRLLPIGTLSDLLHHKFVPIDMYTMDMCDHKACEE